jgi:uncharacterized membrane protein
VLDRLLSTWEYLRTNFWFVPTLMALAGVGLSVATILIDRGLFGAQFASSTTWLWSGGAQGARSVLSTIATSMITVAGTVFSITIAALALTGSQYGSRLLRNFTRDFGNQVVLGTFVTTFLYCLLILRTIRDPSEGDFVPNLSVTCGVVLGIASLGVLIYFIDHISGAIQAENIVAAIGAELKDNIARFCPPGPPGPGDNEPETPVSPYGPETFVRATGSGYVQHLDRDGLVRLADRCDLFIKAALRPGDFSSQGDVLLHVWGAESLADDVASSLRNCFGFGIRRIPLQDVRYGVRQLTDTAARALSPGINNPFTAMDCADWLADALAEMARGKAPSGLRRGATGKPRFLEEPASFDELAALSFEPFRVYGAGNIIVILHVLDVLARLARQVDRPDHRAALLREAEQIAVETRRRLGTGADSERAESALEQARLELTRSSVRM